MNAQRFPIDFDLLQKGSVVGESVIKRLSADDEMPNGYEPEDNRYRLTQLSLQNQIRRYLMGCGKQWAVVCRGTEIRILTDAEVPAKFASMIRKGLKSLSAWTETAAHVDLTKLDSHTARSHETKTMAMRAFMLEGRIGYNRSMRHLPPASKTE